MQSMPAYPPQSYSAAPVVEGYPPYGAFVVPPLVGYPGAELQVNNNLKLPEQPLTEVMDPGNDDNRYCYCVLDAYFQTNSSSSRFALAVFSIDL
ncbi:hypothetical protein MKX01_029327 [Papaver californicum]|nr:hypothetical protein MKX01_029327 [Papaver californicum]